MIGILLRECCTYVPSFFSLTLIWEEVKKLVKSRIRNSGVFFAAAIKVSMTMNVMSLVSFYVFFGGVLLYFMDSQVVYRVSLNSSALFASLLMGHSSL